MKTDFLASTNDFLYFFFRYSSRRKLFFLSSGNVFFNEYFIPTIGKGFFTLMETVTLFESFFLLAETITAMSGDQCLDRTYSSWWNLTFWLVETIFFHCLIYFSRRLSPQLAKTHFSVQKNSSYCFLFRAFFPVDENHFLNCREACLKPLSLLLATIFFDFLDIPANGSSFSV